MYIVRDIFNLKFGQYRPAKALMDEAKAKNFIPAAKHQRLLSDFTGDAYRLILEQGYDTLQEYEQAMQSGLANDEWKQWYENMKQLVERSHREILKVVG
jgi:hypothetical protein